MAQFDLTDFYKRLDGFYDAHDLIAIEQFLKDSREKAQAAGAPLPFNDSCPSCAPAVEPNMDYICVCNEQACFYRGLSRFEECLQAFSAAQTQLEQLYRTDSREYGVVLLNKAGAYRYMGDYQQALSHFQRAGSILEAHDTPADTLAGLYNNMGLLQLDLKQYTEAGACFEKALSLLEKAGKHPVELASTYNNIASGLAAQGKHAEAARVGNDSISILSALDAGLNSHYPAALNTRGTLLYKSGDFEGALEDFQTAAEKTLIIYGRNVEYSAACANCAAACLALDRHDEADKWTQLSQQSARGDKA